MHSDVTHVSIWKTSRRGHGERHLADGYDAEDFPGERGSIPDGCAYFAKDRWIADGFADSRMAVYEDFVIEVQLPVDIYENEFQRFEELVHFEAGNGVQLVIPGAFLVRLNAVSDRTVASENKQENDP